MVNETRTRAIGLVGLATLLAVAASAVPAGDLGAVPAAAQNRLGGATAADCTFPVLAIGTWTEGEASAETTTSNLSFRFEGIDTEDATAEAVGPFGVSHIITRLSGQYLHFLQMFQAGPLYTTTILNQETGDGTFLAVHTRHEYTQISLPGFTSRPEQYYGECELTW